MPNKFWEIAFSSSVKDVQEQQGSRKHYAKFEDSNVTNTILGDQEIDFIEQRDGFYMATVGENLQPYIQFRGGQRGFLKVLDEKTLGFADFRGNLQYISIGNLRKNNKVALFLMDYANRRRLKIFAESEIKQAAEAPELIEKLKEKDYKAKIERAIIFHLEAFDWNCPQHITPRYTMDEIKTIFQPMNDYVEKLEKEIQELKSRTK